MDVAQLLFPFVICAAPRTPGAMAATAGHSAAMALASSSERVTVAPLPSRTPFDVMLPGITRIRLLPIAWICS